MITIKRRKLLSLTALFLVSGLASCTGTTVPDRTPDISNPSSTSVELPDVIYFTDTGAIGLEELEADHGPFRDALATVLGRRVELVALEDQVSAALLLKEGKVDLALAGPSEYVVIKARTNAQPVLALTRPGYRSIFVAKARSGIRAIADLRGKTLALSDIGSTSGHLGPIQILTAAGLNPQTDLEIQMLGDDGSIAALQTDQVEVWGGSSGDYADLVGDNPDDFVVVHEGELLPSDIFIAGSHLELEVVEAIATLMQANEAILVEAVASQQSKYASSELRIPNDAAYDPIRAAYTAIGQGNFLE
ncbi:MAG: phosphate/phosphite/phosphonate ABC transporter substrate-binding protein [Leptolyngbyaceae cyanobacterium]